MNRAERRRQLKADRKLVDGGLNPHTPDSAQVMALMRVLHDLTEDAVSAGSVAPLMSYFYGNMDASARHMRGMELLARLVAHAGEEVLDVVGGQPHGSPRKLTGRRPTRAPEAANRPGGAYSTRRCSVPGCVRFSTSRARRHPIPFRLMSALALHAVSVLGHRLIASKTHSRGQP